MRSSKGTPVQGGYHVTEPSGVLVAARGAGRRYAGRIALAPIDLEVRAGESVALLGPNGAGKTTLLTLLAGAAETSEGTIERASDRSGWVPQRPALYRKLTARENLRLFAELERLEHPHDVAERLLAQVDLLDAADRPAQELSVGNVQRLNVAIGLVADPAVVFLDEPTASLDPRQRARLWELLRAVTGRGGAVVFATQNVEEAHTQADRLVVLQEGRLVFAGAQERVLAAGGRRELQHRRVRARVRALPRRAGGGRLMGAIRALLVKDLRILRRSPLTVALLVIYPLALAVLVGAVIADAGARPRVAFVDLDHLPERASVGNLHIEIGDLLRSVKGEVSLVPMSQEKAQSALSRGDVVAVVVVPQGFLAQLKSLLESPTLTLETSRGAARDRVLREVQSVVFRLNLRLQRVLLQSNIDYLRTLVRGGSAQFLGRTVHVLGLQNSVTKIQQVRGTLGPERPAQRAARRGRALRGPDDARARRRRGDARGDRASRPAARGRAARAARTCSAASCRATRSRSRSASWACCWRRARSRSSATRT